MAARRPTRQATGQKRKVEELLAGDGDTTRGSIAAFFKGVGNPLGKQQSGCVADGVAAKGATLMSGWSPQPGSASSQPAPACADGGKVPRSPPVAVKPPVAEAPAGGSEQTEVQKLNNELLGELSQMADTGGGELGAAPDDVQQDDLGAVEKLEFTEGDQEPLMAKLGGMLASADAKWFRGANAEADPADAKIRT